MCTLYMERISQEQIDFQIATNPEIWIRKIKKTEWQKLKYKFTFVTILKKQVQPHLMSFYIPYVKSRLYLSVKPISDHTYNQLT